MTVRSQAVNIWDTPLPLPTPAQVTEAAAMYGWWPTYPWLSVAGTGDQDLPEVESAR